MWRKFYKHISFFFVLLSFLMTGCFEIIEEIEFNEDGSGHATYTLNMSQSKVKLHSVMLLDSINGYEIPSKNDISLELSELKSRLEFQEGINNVTISKDFDNFIFVLQYDFNGVEALNLAAQQVANSYGGNFSTKKVADYSFAQNTFMKKLNFAAIPDVNKMREKDKQVLEGAKYLSINRFKRQVASMSDKNALLSKSKQAIMRKALVKDLIEGKTDVSNTIILK
jgi:hypothetical protein